MNRLLGTALVVAPLILSTPTVLTPPAGAPLIRSDIYPCDARFGWYQNAYDTDIGGQGATVLFGVFDSAENDVTKAFQEVFLLLTYGPDGTFQRAVTQAGEVFTDFQKLLEAYPTPCRFLQKLRGSRVS